MGYLSRLILKMILITYKSDAHPSTPVVVSAEWYF